MLFRSGAGGNAVNNMILANLEGVEFLIANTDAQAIQQSMCQRCIQLGRNITQGLGAGSRPDIGRAAAEGGGREAMVSNSQADDAQEGMSAFLEKRPPHWKH